MDKEMMPMHSGSYANMPQEVKMKEYPKGKWQGPEGYGDDMGYIDSCNKRGTEKMDSQNRRNPNKQY